MKNLDRFIWYNRYVLEGPHFARFCEMGTQILRLRLRRRLELVERMTNLSGL
jgi:hypothetical protein